MENILVIGIGNSGRRDDGLGWLFLDRLDGMEGFDLVYRYQLQVEDAELISGYSEVWFVDASHDSYEGGFKISDVIPKGGMAYTTHQLPPETVLYLCQDLYQCFPEAKLLGISGSDWGLGLGMSEQAKSRLEAALDGFLQHVNQVAL